MIYPFSIYYIRKNTNRLQWKAVEISESKEMAMNNHEVAFVNNKGEIIEKANLYKSFNLQYRILPSELPFLINVFGDNEWKDFSQKKGSIFCDKEQFKECVEKFKTYGDLMNYHQEKSDLTIWYEPEN